MKNIAKAYRLIKIKSKPTTNLLSSLSILLIIPLLFILISFTTSETGTLKGKVYDKETKEPIPFANVWVIKDGKQLGGTTSDLDGNYIIESLRKVIKVHSLKFLIQILNPALLTGFYYPIKFLMKEYL